MLDDLEKRLLYRQLPDQPSTSKLPMAPPPVVKASSGRKRKQTLTSRKDEGLATPAFLAQMQHDFNKPAQVARFTHFTEILVAFMIHLLQVPLSPPREQVSRHKPVSQSNAITNVCNLIDKLASKQTFPEIDGNYHFKRAPNCLYHAPRTTVSDEELRRVRAPLDAKLHEQYVHAYDFEPDQPLPGDAPRARLRYSGYVRPRMGRGGRYFFISYHHILATCGKQSVLLIQLLLRFICSLF